MCLPNVLLEIQIVNSVQLLEIIKSDQNDKMRKKSLCLPFVRKGILLSNRPSKFFLKNNFILLIIKGIMRDHVSTVSGAHRHETESSTQEELSFSNITCFMITPIITILR